jgi:hypothetical protein
MAKITRQFQPVFHIKSQHLFLVFSFECPKLPFKWPGSLKWPKLIRKCLEIERSLSKTQNNPPNGHYSEKRALVKNNIKIYLVKIFTVPINKIIHDYYVKI